MSVMCLVHGMETLLTQLFNLTSNTTNLLYHTHSYLRSQSLQRHANGSVSVLLTGQTGLPFHTVGLCSSLPTSLAWHGSRAWLALISVTDLSAQAVHINHTFKFSYYYHMRSKSLYTCITFGRMTHYMYTCTNYDFSFRSSPQSPGRSAGPDPYCREQQCLT